MLEWLGEFLGIFQFIFLGCSMLPFSVQSIVYLLRKLIYEKNRAAICWELWQHVVAYSDDLDQLLTLKNLILIQGLVSALPKLL